jgi:hypothetical protein
MRSHLVLSAVGVKMYFVNSGSERPPLADTASPCQWATDPSPRTSIVPAVGRRNRAQGPQYHVPKV